MNKFIYWDIIGEQPEYLRSWRFGKKEGLTDLYERTEVLLGIFPNKRFTIRYVATNEELQSIYREKYDTELFAPAFLVSQK